MGTVSKSFVEPWNAKWSSIRLSAFGCRGNVRAIVPIAARLKLSFCSASTKKSDIDFDVDQ
jgi:hypothetical protein